MNDKVYLGAKRSQLYSQKRFIDVWQGPKNASEMND